MSRDPVPIGDSLNAVVRSMRNEPNAVGSPHAPAQFASQMGSVFGRWTEAVGDAVAEHVTPIKLDGTTLVVEVDDPAWATQMRFFEATLKQRLLQVAGATVDVVEVRVRRR